MLDTHTIAGNLVLVIGEESARIVMDSGNPSVRDVAHQSQLVDSQGRTHPYVDCWEAFTILIPEGMEETRDAIAMILGDTRCRWNWWCARAHASRRPSRHPGRLRRRSAPCSPGDGRSRSRSRPRRR